MPYGAEPGIIGRGLARLGERRARAEVPEC
jgi:hypothetical protein